MKSAFYFCIVAGFVSLALAISGCQAVDEPLSVIWSEAEGVADTAQTAIDTANAVAPNPLLYFASAFAGALACLFGWLGRGKADKGKVQNSAKNALYGAFLGLIDKVVKKQSADENKAVSAQNSGNEQENEEQKADNPENNTTTEEK